MTSKTIRMTPELFAAAIAVVRAGKSWHSAHFDENKPITSNASSQEFLRHVYTLKERERVLLAALDAIPDELLTEESRK